MRECQMPNCGARQEHLVCDRCLTYELSRPKEYATWPADQLAVLVDACTQRIDHYARTRSEIMRLPQLREMVGGVQLVGSEQDRLR